LSTPFLQSCRERLDDGKLPVEEKCNNLFNFVHTVMEKPMVEWNQQRETNTGVALQIRRNSL